MSLRTLYRWTAAVLLVLSLASSAVLLGVTALLHRVVEREGEGIEGLRAVEEAEQDLLLYSRETALAALVGGANHLALRGQARARVALWLVEVRAHVQGAEESALADRLEAAVGRYFAARDAAERESPTLPAVVRGAQRSFDDAISAAEALVAHNLEQAWEARRRARLWERRALALSLGTGLTLIAAFGGLTTALRRLVYRPLGSTAAAIARFGEESPGVRAPDVGPVELRRIARAFNLAADRLEELRRRQARFIAGVAHDLRAPLNALHLAAVVLERRAGDPDGARDVAVRVARQVTRLNRMVDDLLATARIEAGELHLEVAVRDLRALVTDVVSLFDPLPEGCAIAVHPSTAEALSVACDGQRMEQVLGNLIGNAIKYSPEGGLIEVDTRREGGEVVMTVSDRGVGIPAEDLGRIFEPFRRGAAVSQSIPGAGLGLWVSRRIVEAHGGRIEVESVLGAGTAFRVRLPTPA